MLLIRAFVVFVSLCALSGCGDSNNDSDGNAHRPVSGAYLGGGSGSGF